MAALTAVLMLIDIHPLPAIPNVSSPTSPDDGMALGDVPRSPIFPPTRLKAHKDDRLSGAIVIPLAASHYAFLRNIEMFLPPAMVAFEIARIRRGFFLRASISLFSSSTRT